MATPDEKDQAELANRHYWHLEQFTLLGFELHQAEILELAHVDWRDAARLLEHGCPPETAVLILT